MGAKSHQGKQKYSIIFIIFLFFFVLLPTVSASVTSADPVENFPQTDGPVYAMALSEDGNTLYIGGQFSLITDSENQYGRSNLAAINLQNLTVTSWDPGADGAVYAIAVSGSDIFLGGGFNHIGGNMRIEFAKVDNIEGGVDPDCFPYIYYFPEGCPFCQTVYAIEVTDEYIYVGGHFDNIRYEELQETYPRNNLVRFNNNTICSINSWNPNSDGTVYDIEISGSDIFVGGGFSTIGGESRSEFAKLNNTNGGVDANCNPNFYTADFCELYPEYPSCSPSTIYSIKVSENDIYVGGSFTNVGGAEGPSRHGLAKLDKANCSLQSWNPEASSTQFPIFKDLEVSGTDIYLGGKFDTFNDETTRNNLALLDSEGNINSWNPNVQGETVETVLITANYLITGGNFETVRNRLRYYLAAFPYEAPTTPTPTTAPTATPTPTSTTTSTTTSSSSNSPQIPQSSESESGGKVVMAVNETPGSSVSSSFQKITAIVENNTFNFDAFLSSQIVVPVFSSGLLTNPLAGTIPSPSVSSNNIFAGDPVTGGILGIQTTGGIAWQIGNIQNIWYKAYAPGYEIEEAAKIIPDLQKTPSIISLSYTDIDLIPPGQPNKSFNPKSLKLAYSLDGITWTILSSSVVDPVNRTVAAIHKIGGYYMIVAGVSTPTTFTLPSSQTLGETIDTKLTTKPTISPKTNSNIVVQSPTQTPSIFQRISAFIQSLFD